MMYQEYFEAHDVLMMLLVPPLLGSAVGLLGGLARRRPGRAAVGGLVGGTTGAWAGVVLYRSLVLPRACDPAIFQACVLGGFLLGAIPLAWYVGGPAAAGDSRPAPRWALASLVCSDLGCVGAVALAVVAAGPQADTTGVSAGLAVLCLGFPSVVLWLLGLSFGVVALARDPDGRGGGRGWAWAGIILGGLPLAWAAALAGPALGWWQLPW